VIFCCRAQHGRPANVNVFDCLGESALRLGDRRAKRVQVHHEQVDTLNAMLVQGLQVLGAIASGKQATMNFWMQSFDATI
jgi:hypothetical protein